MGLLTKIKHLLKGKDVNGFEVVTSINRKGVRFTQYLNEHGLVVKYKDETGLEKLYDYDLPNQRYFTETHNNGYHREIKYDADGEVISDLINGQPKPEKPPKPADGFKRTFNGGKVRLFTNELGEETEVYINKRKKIEWTFISRTLTEDDGTVSGTSYEFKDNKKNYWFKEFDLNDRLVSYHFFDENERLVIIDWTYDLPDGTRRIDSNSQTYIFHVANPTDERCYQGLPFDRLDRLYNDYSQRRLKANYNIKRKYLKPPIANSNKNVIFV